MNWLDWFLSLVLIEYVIPSSRIFNICLSQIPSLLTSCINSGGVALNRVNSIKKMSNFLLFVLVLVLLSITKLFSCFFLKSEILIFVDLRGLQCIISKSLRGIYQGLIFFMFMFLRNSWITY